MKELEKDDVGFTEEKERMKREQEGAMDANFEPTKKGGLKAPSSAIKIVTINETKPGICKPYYQKGFCPYGDSCKYAHIREDYSAAAQDAEYENGGVSDSDSDSSSDSDDGLSCPICQNQYKDPIVTICCHTFCADCAMTHFEEKSRKCFLCNRDTRGTFNPATALIRHIEQLNAQKKLSSVNNDMGDSKNDDDDDKDILFTDADHIPKAAASSEQHTTSWVIPAASSTWTNALNK
eukprot:TRINITY_DN9477_c0_g1_i1.p1 TRINITY_DN9477_c0_g1~~TRINITY_DN9477_c0_g1_i1.p1  ORF type:complete len:236 (+),score=52.40 TRINITY_DN9477_c0_g1_i1:213-920(+)